MSTKRSTCNKCKKPLKVCICASLKDIPNNTHIIILQHPSEQKHPLGSAKIVELCLNNAEILIGDNFSEHEYLNKTLQSKSCYLLYPYEHSTLLNDDFVQENKVEVLIILDGTWKKARKIFHLTPPLQKLPLLKLDSPKKSDYKIRKQPKDSGLSTLESIVESLNFLEPDLDTQALTKSFNLMIENQIKLMGTETFKKNYS